MNSEQDAAQVFGYDVTDSDGNKIGSVDNVWVDDATSELEFVGVKTGWFMGKTHVIPVANAQISGNSIQVPFSEDQIKGAPHFDGDEELSPEQEDEIYGYYGEDRSTAASPTGLPAGGTTGFVDNTNNLEDTDNTDSGTYATSDAGSNDYATANADNANYTGNNSGDETMTLHQEQLQADKRQVEAGRVRLRKVVRTEHQEVPVDLRREEVQIERVPASGDTTDDSAFQEQEIEVPVMREEAVVGTTTQATEQVRLNKSVTTDTENVGGDVRREDVVTDGDRFTGNAGTDYDTTDTESSRDSNY